MKKIALLVALAAFLSAGIPVVFFTNSVDENKLKKVETELAGMPAKIAKIDSMLNEKITELEIQKGINAEQDYKINEQLMQLEAQKETIALVKKLTKEKNYPEANRVLNKYLEAYPQ